MQGKKIEVWFVSQARREYFGAELTAYLFAKQFVFFTSEAIKIAVSFSKFQCLYAMLLIF